MLLYQGSKQVKYVFTGQPSDRDTSECAWEDMKVSCHDYPDSQYHPYNHQHMLKTFDTALKHTGNTVGYNLKKQGFYLK